MMLQPPKESESTGCATCVNTGEEERNAKIPSNAIGVSNQTKTEAATSSVAVVPMDGLVAGSHVQRRFSEMSLTGFHFSELFKSMSVVLTRSVVVVDVIFMEALRGLAAWL